MNIEMKLILALLITTFLTWSCKTDAPKPTIVESQKQPAQQIVPIFEGNRAFDYLKAQTDFGPRNPGSIGHRNCLNYLQSEMQKYADAVNVQPFTVSGYDKEILKLTNVISSFNLQASTRKSDIRALKDPRPAKKRFP